MHATTASRSRMPTRPTPAGPARRATRAPASRTPISALGLPCGRVRARAPQRRLEAETTLGATPSPLLALLDKARAREQAAETSCVDGDRRWRRAALRFSLRVRCRRDAGSLLT